MFEPTAWAVAVAAALGVLGGLANEAYAYLKMHEPFTPKECAAKAFIGLVVGILVPVIVMPSLVWSALMVLAFTAGYFGIDAVEFIIGGKPKET